MIELPISTLQASVDPLNPPQTGIDNFDPGKPFKYPRTPEHRGLNENLDILKTTLQLICLNRNLMIEKLSDRVNVVFKKNAIDTSYSIRVTSRGDFYIHLGVRLVSKGDGGNEKVDKLCYDYGTGKFMAKLTTKIEGANKEKAENEEKFLLFCSEKNLPHIVKTKEVIWEQRGTCLKQIIIQDFGAHGRLSDSLDRLKD
jgi:hypothetical protein